MKQISISDRQQTGRMEAIGAENKLWSSQGSKDAVSVSKPMYCFVEAFKMKMNGTSAYGHKDVVQDRTPIQANEKGHGIRPN